MKTLSKFMATTAVCTLIAGGALAQAAMQGGQVGAEDIAPEAQPELPQGTTTMPSGEGVGPGTVPGVGPGETDPVIVASAALERGEVVPVVSADGQTLGAVSTAVHEANGAARLSIALDGGLDTSAQRVTFVGMAEIDSDGRVILPLAQADFLSQVNAQMADPAG